MSRLTPQEFIKLVTKLARRNSRPAAIVAGVSLISGSLGGLGGGDLGIGRPAAAQQVVSPDACCYQPAYRLQCTTVMEPQTVTTMRPVWETVTETREVPETRMVRKVRIEEREYTVAKPVTETAYREEEYTVMRPILDTSVRQQQRTVTRMVTETSEREEQYTTYRPIVETQIQQRQYQVARPVTETVYQTQAYTAMRPVTTYQNQVVDAGGYVAQNVVVPGQVGYGLQWVPRAYQTTGPFGILAVNRGGLFWTPQATPPTVQTQVAYRPNYITQQIAQTQYVPETIQQQVPVQRTTMQTETITENVPVSVSKLQPVVETRRIPVTVQRPVTETVTEDVPVQSYRMVQETKTRRIPVVSTRMEYETRKQPVQVEYYEPETTTRQVVVTRQVQRMVPHTSTVMVARPVVQAVSPAYFDRFGAAISIIGYPSTPLTGSSVLEASKPAVDDEADQTPNPRLSEVKERTTDSEPSPSDQDGNASDHADNEDTGQPSLRGPENQNDDADAST